MRSARMLRWLWIALGTSLCALGIVAPASRAELVFNDTRCEQGPCGNAIWTASDDGRLQRRVTVRDNPSPYGGNGDGAASWAPDGRRIVFSRFGGEATGTYVVGSDGAGLRRIDDGTAFGPVWSPRGDVIAFTSSSEPQAGGLPDSGTGLSFGIDDTDIFLIDPEGSGLRRVVNGLGREMDPRFSQDGSRVIFYREGTGPGGLVGEGDDSGWYSVALDGGDERRLTVGLPPMPKYSPDGQFLAMVTRWDELYTMRADGTQIRRWAGRVSYGSQLAWTKPTPVLFFPVWLPGTDSVVIHRADFSVEEPRAQPVARGGAVDWTDGAGGGAGPDRLAPATVLLGPEQRPLNQYSQGAYAAARVTGAPVISERKLHFFAVDRTGVRRVEAALGRVGRRGRCRFLGSRSFGRMRPCSRPIFREVRSDPEWRKRLARLSVGRHLLGFRAVDVNGNRTRRPRLTLVRLR